MYRFGREAKTSMDGWHSRIIGYLSMPAGRTPTYWPIQLGKWLDSRKCVASGVKKEGHRNQVVLGGAHTEPQMLIIPHVWRGLDVSFGYIIVTCIQARDRCILRLIPVKKREAEIAEYACVYRY